jgi:site-specific recombinase XerD
VRFDAARAAARMRSNPGGRQSPRQTARAYPCHCRTSGNIQSRKYTPGMTSGNTTLPGELRSESASGNTAPHAAAPLPLHYAAALAGYQRALRTAPLAEGTRAKYVSRVRGYLTWLASSDPEAPQLEQLASTSADLIPELTDPAARDGAVRDWRAWAKTVARHRPTTINNTLAAVDDFYTRRGLGPAHARREALPRRAPKALTERQVVHYLRAVEHHAPSRDHVIALLPFYAGLRISEVVGLDLDDVALSARKGSLRIRGKGRDGGKLRDIPLARPELRAALTIWLTHRHDWTGADQPALLLNQRGGRLSDRAARTVITTLGEHAGLGTDPDNPFGPHVLRHTFATQLIRAGTDPVLVADLLGHTSLDTVALYSRPTDHDREQALTHLTTDN